MKKAKVIRLGGLKFISTVKENSVIVLFTVLFSVGVLFGCLLYKYNVLCTFGSSITKAFIYSHKTDSFCEILFSTFILSFCFLFVTYLLGTSLLGMAFIPCTLFTRGLFSGLMLGELYSNGVMNALITNLFTLIPGMLICVPALICASKQSLDFSYNIGKLISGEGQSRFNIDIKRYLVHFCLITVLTLLGATFESFLSIFFRKFLI